MSKNNKNNDIDMKVVSKEEEKKRKSDLTSSAIVDDDEEGNCGYGSWEPGFLQCCNSPKGFLVVYCFLVIVQGMLVNGFINVSISTLEKRFGFGSSEAGVMATSYDIAFCCATMFVTYFGARKHRPRLVGIGCFIMGLGAMIFWLPHFTTDQYSVSDSFEETCTEDDGGFCEDASNQSVDYSYYIYVFILAQLLHGLGCTPLFTLGLSFMEDSVAKESASLYLGIGNAASIFGPVLGYAFGGYVLGIYVDFESVPSSDVNIEPSDPRWVGAWWLGMMASMVGAWIICIPLFGFPKVFPGAAKYRRMRESEVPVDGGAEVAEREGFGKKAKDFPIALLTLLKNPTYMLGSLASCSEAMVVSGFTTFLPKIIENEFQQTAGTAALVAGLIGVPGGVVGHVVAGILVNRFKLKTANIFKLNVLYCIIVIAAAPVLFLYCPNRPVAGITVPYINTNNAEENLTATCNANCSCQEEFYIPVCGADNINYFTACHAGCGRSEVINDTAYFFDCTCVNGTNSEGGWMAKEGHCASECDSLPLFLGIFFFVVFFNFMSNTPSLIATFRVVPPNMRSFALGVQWLLIRGLGSIPGPILFGTIIDLTCILWQTRQCSGSRGSCWINDSREMAINVLAISVACKVVSAILFFSAFWFYKPPPDKQELPENHDNSAFDDDGNHDNPPTNRASCSSQGGENGTVTSSDDSITAL